VYRWPLLLESRSVHGEPNASMEISPRALGFTLQALAEMGHPAHVALIDAYLRGEVRVRETGIRIALGYDSADVAAHLVAPLLLAYELGWEQIDLRDVVLLPPTRTPDYEDREERGLLFAARRRPLWAIVTPGDLIGFGSRPEKWPGWRAMDRPGHVEAFVRLPDSDALEKWRSGRAGTPPILAAALVYEAPPPTPIGRFPLTANAEDLAGAATGAVSAALRRLALGRAARAPRVMLESAGAMLQAIGMNAEAWTASQRTWLQQAWCLLLSEAQGSSGVDFGGLPEDIADAYLALGDRAAALGLGRPSKHVPGGQFGTGRLRRIAVASLGAVAAGGLSPALAPVLDGPRFADGVLAHHGLSVDVAVAPEADGGATLSLLPPSELEPNEGLVERMEGAARAVLVELMGVPFAEERKEAIEHRLVGAERTTTLLVGWSLVLPRNRRVFAAWLGSDGRVMIRLFPPEGRPARGRA
jgi:hypothetical protein